VMPGGDTRASTFYRPYPTVIESGEGAHLHDVDGNVLLNFLNNYTSLVHGNAYSPVVEAVAKQLERGTAWAAPNEHQIHLASLICERIPSVARLRFTNSGTEATMQAIRVARAFSGREAIIKVEGGYHGTHEAAGVSIEPDPSQAGPAAAPLSLASDPGILRGTLEAVHIVPYNNSDALEQALTSFHGEFAAVIMEPMLGSRGMIPADEVYLHFVREITEEHDTLLILDEVMTLRLDLGGGASDLWRRARSNYFRQDYRRWISSGCFRGAGGDHGSLQALGPRHPSRWNVQRQPGGYGRRGSGHGTPQFREN